MRKYVVEFIGTFFLVLTVGLTVAKPGVGSFAPLAIGFVLMVMIYAGGHISGAHYNPAITLSALLAKKINIKMVPGYILAQFLGAIFASLMFHTLRPDSFSIPADISWQPALLAEMLFSFALAYVILNVACSKATAGNSYYGLAIGLTVTAGAYAVGGISGAVFNPAVGIGLHLMFLSKLSDFWIYLVGPILGATYAAVVFNWIQKEE